MGQDISQGYSLVEVLIALLLLSLFLITSSVAISNGIRHATHLEDSLNNQSMLYTSRLYDLLSAQYKE